MPQCQFLFSAVFGFRKVTQKIFSELDVTKANIPIFTMPKQRTEDGSQGGHTYSRRGLPLARA